MRKRRYRPWTAEEDAILLEMIVSQPYREISRRLGRSTRACSARAWMRGLCSQKGSAAHRERCRRAMLGRRNNPATEFKPGHAPWNKGMKGLHMSPATEFKPGELRGQAARRYRAVGQVTVRRDNTGRRRRWIKVRNDGRVQYRFIPLARHLWLTQRGPIPAGCHVVHVDGDTLNDDLANLALMTRKQQTTWQRGIRPEMEARRRAAVVRSLRVRAEVNRAKREAGIHDVRHSARSTQHSALAAGGAWTPETEDAWTDAMAARAG